MVLQDTWLFGGTIRENIAYGRPDATEEEILAAAEATYVDRFVHACPTATTRCSTTTATTSARARSSCSRSRGRSSPTRAMLILDEATSSVDTRTELLVQQAMSALRRDRTSFVIAHRLSTIRDADLILVMEHGDIVEQGTHDRAARGGRGVRRACTRPSSPPRSRTERPARPEQVSRLREAVLTPASARAACRSARRGVRAAGGSAPRPRASRRAGPPPRGPRRR